MSERRLAIQEHLAQQLAKAAEARANEEMDRHRKPQVGPHEHEWIELWLVSERHARRICAVSGCDATEVAE